ncbi:hypothetical protein I4U23_022276 [Adineta vaga]|nr:hypothetical protein I4U23_022276 [Adineta vaga]
MSTSFVKLSYENDAVHSLNSIEISPFVRSIVVDNENDISSFERTDNFNMNVMLLKSSFSKETFENISGILKQVIGTNLMIIQEQQDYQWVLDRTDLSVIVSSFKTKTDQSFLEKLCSRNQPPSIYLFGSQPTTQHETEKFFTKYYSICYMSDNLEELSVHIAIDMTMQSRIRGDQHARKKKQELRSMY